MYVVHHNTLLDSFQIRIVKIHYPIISCIAANYVDGDQRVVKTKIKPWTWLLLLKKKHGLKHLDYDALATREALQMFWGMGNATCDELTSNARKFWGGGECDYFVRSILIAWLFFCVIRDNW